MFKVNFVVLAL